MINGYRRFEKIRLFVALGAFLCALALLVCYAAVFTVSKYETEIDGYTDFEISSFHAILLGDMTKEDIMETWTGSSSITLFGENISAVNLVPGMETKTIPFSLANGTSADDISGMDIDYTMRLRTTGNIPLTFTLIWKEKNGDSVTEHRFVTGAEYFLEEGNDGDAPQYIYTFFEDDNGQIAEEEHSFYMSGGSLSVESFELQITWPVTDDAYGESTNSTKYMKEVDIIDMLAVISSKNRSETYTGGASTPTYYSDGYIVVNRGGGDYGSETEGECFVHTFDLRAFEVQSSAVNETVSDYSFVVGNGNDIYNNNVLKHPTSSQYTNFSVEIALPLTEDTRSRDESLRSCAIFVEDKYDSDSDGDTEEMLEITPVSISYRLYDITDDTYENFDTRAEAISYITETDYVYSESKFRMYEIITPSVAEDVNQAYRFSLNNIGADSAHIYDSLKFTVRMYGSEINSSAIAVENVPRVVVTAYYENSLPDNRYVSPEPEE